MFQATEKQHDVGITIMRVVAGLVFVMHGWQKFSTMGHSGVTGFFGQAHIPFASVSAWIVMLLELVGGVLLAIGFLTRVIAAAFAFEMLVAIAAVHFKHGFFMPHLPFWRYRLGWRLRAPERHRLTR